MKLKKLPLALGTVLLASLSVAHAVDPSEFKTIEQRVSAIESKMINWRRDIHQHPELSNQEHRTAKLVAEHLRSLGLEVQTGVANSTGVVAILRGRQPGKVIALRADMDALPVKELVDLPFASKAKGKHMGKEVDVMHACGHDAHTAILMATAEILSGMKDKVRGTVKFIFQPAEEGMSEPHSEDDHIGAEAMVRAGVLDNPKVDAVFGLHVNPWFPTGTVAYRPGAILASGDTFMMKVTGKQAHGAFPWAGIDSVMATSQIVMGLQTIVSRQLELIKEPAIISIGSIHGGSRENIIPESVELLGTVRTFDDSMRQDTLQRMRTTAEHIAMSSGAKAEIKIQKPGGYAATVNNEDLTARMLPTLQQATGGKAVLTSKLSASDDFAEFAKKVPGLFFFLGSTSPSADLKKAPPNHSPKFELDEASLAVGARTMTAMVIDYLRQP